MVSVFVIAYLMHVFPSPSVHWWFAPTLVCLFVVFVIEIATELVYGAGVAYHLAEAQFRKWRAAVDG